MSLLSAFGHAADPFGLPLFLNTNSVACFHRTAQDEHFNSPKSSASQCPPYVSFFIIRETFPSTSHVWTLPKACRNYIYSEGLWTQVQTDLGKLEGKINNIYLFNKNSKSNCWTLQHNLHIKRDQGDTEEMEHDGLGKHNPLTGKKHTDTDLKRN